MSSDIGTQFDKYALAYQEKFLDFDLYNDTYDRLLERLPAPDARVLELGCGPGNITRYLLARQPQLHITATDLGPKMVELAQVNNPGATCRVLDARHLDQLSGVWQAIVSGFCLPYLTEAETSQLIRDAAAQLSPGGLLYLSSILPDAQHHSGYETTSNGQDTFYVHYHRPEVLEQFLLNNNLEITDRFHKPYLKQENIISTHLILIARKK